MTILEIMMLCFLANTFLFRPSTDSDDPLRTRGLHWPLFGLLLLADLIYRSHLFPW